MVRKVITRAFGERLHTIVSKSTKNRFMAFFAGIGVTTVLQSSTATALIISSFASHGILTVSAGVAVMLGADVGTTLVAQILSFDLSWVAPVFLFGGYMVYRIFKSRSRVKHIGATFVGLGIMLLALGFIKMSAAPLRDSETLALVLDALSSEPALALIISAVLTWIMHSSLATVLLYVTLIASGVLHLQIALVMVLGANIGGAIAPIIVTMREGPEAARVPVANMGMRLVGGLVCLPFIPYLTEYINTLGMDDGRMVVNFHTAFNILLFLLFIPFTTVIGRTVEKMMPSKVDADDPSTPKYLDKKDLGTPAVAISDATRETLRLADVVEGMMEDFIKALENNDNRLLKDIIARDDIVDSLYVAIKHYMARITDEALDEDQSQQYIQILSFSTNLEAVGDTIEKSLADIAEKKIDSNATFSDAGWKEIKKIHKLVSGNMKLAQNVMMSGDEKLARQLVESKDTIRNHESKAATSHLNRIRDGVPETIATSSIHLDIIRDYRRINSYIATVAYPILEDAGYLRKRRLKSAKK